MNTWLRQGDVLSDDIDEVALEYGRNGDNDRATVVLLKPRLCVWIVEAAALKVIRTHVVLDQLVQGLVQQIPTAGSYQPFLGTAMKGIIR